MNKCYTFHFLFIANTLVFNVLHHFLACIQESRSTVNTDPIHCNSTHLFVSVGSVASISL